MHIPYTYPHFMIILSSFLLLVTKAGRKMLQQPLKCPKRSYTGPNCEPQRAVVAAVLSGLVVIFTLKDKQNISTEACFSVEKKFTFTPNWLWLLWTSQFNRGWFHTSDVPPRTHKKPCFCYLAPLSVKQIWLACFEHDRQKIPRFYKWASIFQAFSLPCIQSLNLVCQVTHAWKTSL